MIPSVDTLVQQEKLVFTPVSGTFDVDQVADAIAGIGFSFRDEADPSRFVIASDEASRNTFQERRRKDPNSRFPYVPLVRATPEQVALSPMPDPEQLRDLSVQFIEWLTSTYDCRVSDPFGTDLSAPPTHEPRAPEG
jgi:hypothetical protein